MTRLAALVAVLALALAPPGAALGHSALIATSPVSGETVASAPDRVALTFDAGVDGPSATVRVLAADGGRADAGPVRAESGRHLSVPLRADLADGTYTVAWRAISDDSHPIRGAFLFSVGAPGERADAGAVAAALAGPPGHVGAGLAVARFLAFALVLIAAGGAMALAVALCGAPPGSRAAVRRLVAGACVALVPVSIAAVVLLAAQRGATAIAGALGAGPLGDALGTRAGAAWLAAAAVAAVAATALTAADAPAPGRGRRALAALGLALAVALVALPGLAGHAAAGGAAAYALDVAHVAGAAAWTGGLGALLLGLRAARGERWELARRAVPRFSALAGGAVAVLVAAGSAGAWMRLGSPADLWSTGYGRLLLAKLAAVAIIVVIGIHHRRVAVPLLRAGAASARARRGFLRACGAELVVAVAALALTAALVGRSPAAATSPGLVAEEVVAAGPYRVEARAAAAGRDAVRILLRVTDPAGAPAEPAALEAEAYLPEGDVGPMRLRVESHDEDHRAHAEVFGLAALPEGHYEIPRARLGLPGEWDVRIRLVAGARVHEASFRVPMRGA